MPATSKVGLPKHAIIERDNRKASEHLQVLLSAVASFSGNQKSCHKYETRNKTSALNKQKNAGGCHTMIHARDLLSVSPH